METLERRARKKLWEVKKMLPNLPATPEFVTYVQLSQSLQDLYFHGRYEIVCDICDILLRDSSNLI